MAWMGGMAARCNLGGSLAAPLIVTIANLQHRVGSAGPEAASLRLDTLPSSPILSGVALATAIAFWL
jgi:hypothetical protein